jgi:CXXX repeat peptide maturase
VISHLVAVVAQDAPSFCHYAEMPVTREAPSLMPYPILQALLRWCEQRNVALNFLHGGDPLPAEHDAAIENAGHARIVPVSLAARYPEAVLVAGPRDYQSLIELSPNRSRVLILRADVATLPQLPQLIATALPRSRRVNLLLERPDLFGEEDFSAYRAALADIAETLRDHYLGGRARELNVLSDRLMLSAPNDCGAGERHLTVGTDGQFYLCPAFFHARDQEYVSGSLETGPRKRNPELFGRGRAPICRECDAFQCKRCLYLNREATLEINTPSREQCVLAHLEREASIHLRRKLVRDNEAFRRFREPPDLEFFDPFERTGRQRRNRAQVTLGRGERSSPELDVDHMSESALAARIAELQAELARRRAGA